MFAQLEVDMNNDIHIPECRHCGDQYSTARWAIGYKWCLPCGDIQAHEARKSWTVAPMHKSNYILITSLELLVGLNNKQAR